MVHKDGTDLAGTHRHSFSFIENNLFHMLYSDDGFPSPNFSEILPPPLPSETHTVSVSH